MKAFMESVKRFFIQRRLLPKLLCLLLSVFIWAFIGNRQSGRVMFRVPIEFTHLSEGLVISDYSDKYVFVSLEGKKEYLKGLTVKNLNATVDLSNAVVGESKGYILNIERRQVPDSVALNSTLREVSLTIERVRNKWVKVIPRISGASSGKIVGRIRLTPEYVMISGPESQLQQIPSVETDEISLEDEYEDLIRNVEIDQRNYRDIKFSETTIRVMIPIVKNENVYSVEVPITGLKGDDRFRVDTEDLKVRVYVRQGEGSKLDVSDIEASIDTGAVQFQQLYKNGTKAFSKVLPVSIRMKSNRAALADVVSFIPDTMEIRFVRK
ncbi:MAG: hypothetical protein JXA20_06180 [Spirochaetes bacterium]|nr:hypothetical protein [Spirochaetota bacterium]